jgi:predicted RNase H-like HicB family nuclease
MELSYTYWEAVEGGFLGFINQYPDYWTQGETIEELEVMLKSLYQDIKAFDDIKPPVPEHTGTLSFART